MKTHTDTDTYGTREEKWEWQGKKYQCSIEKRQMKKEYSSGRDVRE